MRGQKMPENANVICESSLATKRFLEGFDSLLTKLRPVILTSTDKSAKLGPKPKGADFLY